MTTALDQPQYSFKDFASDQDVRWCPGCGDYSILAAVKKTLAQFDVPPEKYAFISGIGCSSRFPYYMNTYGIHGIHGRAMAIATGLKVARPDLNVWVITGDGDGLSIGGNHTLHTLRRNVDLKILLFNNQIYGLTKGQYSPTSPFGKKTKSTPMGSLDWPLLPLAIALASESTFVARAVDTHPKHLIEVLTRAHQHRGAAFVEIYQNCNIFNDGAFAYAQDRKIRADHIIELNHGEPMVFGANQDKGLALVDNQIRVVTLGEGGFKTEDLLVHDEKAPMAVHFKLARLRQPDFPEPIGVLRAVDRPTYNDLVNDQIAQVVERKGHGDVQALLRGRSTWEVNGEPAPACE